MKEYDMKALKMLARLLVVIGALNWGLWGFFQFDLVAFIFGGNSTMMARLVYAVIGLSGVVALKNCCGCPCSCHSSGKGGKGCNM